MPVIFVATHTRPDTSVPFYTFTEAEAAHFRIAQDAGLVTRRDEYSDDQLIKTVVRTFVTPEAYAAHVADSFIPQVSIARELYNAQHGHTSEFSQS